jgi:hypothetical protein
VSGRASLRRDFDPPAVAREAHARQSLSLRMGRTLFAQDDAAIDFARGGSRRLDKPISTLTTMEPTGSIAVDSS